MGGIKEELSSLFQSFSTATTIALSVVFSTFAGVLTGYYLDNHVFKGRTTPWLTLIGLLFGLAGGVNNFFLLTKRFNQEKEKQDKKKGETDKGK